MKIVVDEHVPLMTVEVLRELGHEVREILGTSLACIIHKSSSTGDEDRIRGLPGRGYASIGA